MSKILIGHDVYHYMGGRLVLVEKSPLYDLSLTPEEAEEASKAQREVVLEAARANGRR